MDDRNKNYIRSVVRKSYGKIATYKIKYIKKAIFKR